jgi:hypothetical protein
MTFFPSLKTMLEEVSGIKKKEWDLYGGGKNGSF